MLFRSARFMAALGMGGEWALGVALVMEAWPERHRSKMAGFIGMAANLGMVTPAGMRFSIEGQVPPMAAGAIINHRIRIGPFPVRWRTRIASWAPGQRFVDLQERGPYRLWWHEHSFQADGSRTVMEDRVYYTPPLGLIGRLAHGIFIRSTLRKIFQYRGDVIRLRFGVA